MTNNQLTEAELTETLDAATSGYPLTASAEENLRRVFAELQERRKAAMDSEPVGSISIDRLLQLLYQFDGANECAASIGDKEYALECGYVASALRELLSCRSALPVADVVAWSHPNEERKCDIRWRRHDVEPGPLYRHAQPAPVVPDENVSFHRLPGESEYDRLNRQREWMESKSKLAKVTAAAPDDLTERLLRLRAQATLDGSYLDTEEWDSLACDVIKALNACRAAMLQSRCSIQPAPALDFEPKTAEARCGNSPAKNSVAPAQSPIDHGYRPGCECSGCKTTVRICAELAGNSPVIPDGYVIVPKEPTERMVIAGFESEPDEGFSELQVWEAYEDMSGCEQAAYRARLCWAAMLAAAPQEVQGEHRIRDEMDMGARITSHRFKV
ncbi:TPA: hypothetical protein ACYEOW_001205 [Raoultella terrigena]